MKKRVYDKYMSICNLNKLKPIPQIERFINNSIEEVEKNSSSSDNINNNLKPLSFNLPGHIPENYKSKLVLEDLHPLIGVFYIIGINIIDIDLSYNKLGQKCGVMFEKMLENTIHLKSLNLKSNMLDDLVCVSLVKVILNKNKKLEYLNLNSNEIGNLGIMEISKLVLQINTLYYLDIGRNHYDWDGLIAINYVLKPLKKNKKLLNYNKTKLNDNMLYKQDNKVFDLNNDSKNNIISKSDLMIETNEIDESMFSYLPKLRVLNVDDPYYAESDQDFFTHFGKMLQCNLHLKKLSLRFHKLKFDGCKILFHYLENNSSLRVLDLSNNQICFQGIQYISNFLEDKIRKDEKKRPSNLISLNLSGNRLHDKGAELLSKGIERNSTLSYIDLTDNRIKEEGLLHLYNGILNNKTIQHLKIFKGNYWGRQAIDAYKILIDNKDNFYTDFKIYNTNLKDNVFTDICYNEDYDIDVKEYLV